MLNDSDLQQAVLAELSWEPSVIAAHLGVTAKNGVVTLTGHVESFAQKHAAETAARRVRGVDALAEEIEVRLPVDTKRSDEDIAAAAIDRLAWDVSVPPGAIQVTVEQGWLTLTGAVDRHYQQQAAEQDVRRLFGVVGVSNRIAIKAAIDASTISDDIMHALHRSWLFDENNVKVSAVGGRVHLTGSVDSWLDRQTAASTAWAAPGTTSVENDIRVN